MPSNIASTAISMADEGGQLQTQASHCVHAMGGDGVGERGWGGGGGRRKEKQKQGQGEGGEGVGQRGGGVGVWRGEE